jgi:hypothetical protein
LTRLVGTGRVVVRLRAFTEASLAMPTGGRAGFAGAAVVTGC